MIGFRVALALMVAALLLFAWIGVRAARRFGVGDRDAYLSARRSQGATAIGVSLFASALGAWILFSPPEVGTFGGLLGIGGYALGQAAAVAIFGWLGPRVRARIPEGATVLDFVRLRFGAGFGTYVGAVSVLYMFLFLTAELTAVGGVVALLTGGDPLVPILLVAGVTAAYTAYGGLPASLATDRWQGWLMLGLVVAATAGIAASAGDPVRSAADGGAWALTGTGAELLVILVVAVVAANLFHQGYWQRVWAARDDRALRAGTAIGGALIVPVVFLAGLAGAVAVGGGAAGEPSVAFFSLLAGLPGPAVAVVVGLAVALVASSVDTLQNGLGSLIAVHVGRGRLRLGAARAVVVALTLPAVVIAAQGLSVLRIFLVADLLAATIALPVFLGLWDRVDARSAVAGAVAGILAVVALGWARGGTPAAGLLLLSLPHGLALGPFVVAPVASGIVTALVALRPSSRPRPRRARAEARSSSG